MGKRVVYVAHPVGGDVEGNIRALRSVLRELRLTRKDIIPVAPYLACLQYLHDNNPAERSLGMEENRLYFERGLIDEVLLAGETISPGMREEIALALHLGIPVSCLREELEPRLRQVLQELDAA